MSKILWCFRCQREPDENCEYCRYFPACEYVEDGDEEVAEDDDFDI